MVARIIGHGGGDLVDGHDGGFGGYDGPAVAGVLDGADSGGMGDDPGRVDSDGRFHSLSMV